MHHQVIVDGKQSCTIQHVCSSDCAAQDEDEADEFKYITCDSVLTD